MKNVSNPVVEAFIQEGHKYSDLIDEYAKQAVTFDMAWDLIEEINDWALLACSQLTLLDENVSRVKNLLASNPTELNALVFARKMTDYKKSQIRNLEKLKDFVLRVNTELIKKVDTHPLANTIYVEIDKIYTVKDIKVYPLRSGTGRRKIFDLLLAQNSPISGTVLMKNSKQKNYSVLNKAIKGINEVAKEKLDIDSHIIVKNDNGGYQLNRLTYRFVEL